MNIFLGIVRLPSPGLGIDTSGWGVISGALFNEVYISCSPNEHFNLDIIRYPIIKPIY